MNQFSNAFVQGEESTHAEKYEGNDKSPEVALATVAELPGGSGSTLGPTAAEQEQRLVAGVGE
ncbi:MAG: hypothetical protein RLZZ199_1686 [Actinomycetota bacterium]